MGKIIEIIINRWDGGIVNDPRDPRENTARIVTNFDVFTSPRKMTPYRSSESGDVSASTRQTQNFALARASGVLWRLYGLSVVSGLATAAVRYKSLTTGAANDLDDDSWVATSNNESASGSTSFNLFVFYRRTSLIYGARAGTHIWAYDPSGGAAFADTHQALTYSEIGQGLVHSKDDILYIPYYNNGGFIAKNDNGSWTTAALTLPLHYLPTSICEYGNYLAIGCAHVNGIENSRIFLWDRDSSLTTLNESIDAGSGSLIVMEEIDGELIWISQQGGSATSFAAVAVPAGSISQGDRAYIRRLSGNHGEKLFEMRCGSNTTILPIAKQKVDDRLYFMMQISLNGALREGVWSVGRSDYTGRFTLVHERTPNNDTALVSSYDLHNFIKVGDYLFQSYTSGGDVGMSKTDDEAIYNHTSIYESTIYDLGDPSIVKKLYGVSVFTEFLPSGGQVLVRYAIDENIGAGTWTTILTHSTDNAVSKSAINIESTGATLPEYRQIQFRLEATSGASASSPTEITGLSFKSEIINKRNYD